MRNSDKANVGMRESYSFLDSHYAPKAVARRRFNSWKQTKEGKLFKKRLYTRQKGRCANPECRCRRTLGEFHIDHIKPLSKHPALALSRRNLQLLCSVCNTRKGAGQLPSFRPNRSTRRKKRRKGKAA